MSLAMREIRHLQFVGLTGIVLICLCSLIKACKPADVPTLERAICVVIKAEAPDASEICATADELAPFVPLLIASREGPPPVGPSVALALSKPSKAKPRRHCTQWTPVDAGVEGGP